MKLSKKIFLSIIALIVLSNCIHSLKKIKTSNTKHKVTYIIYSYLQGLNSFSKSFVTKRVNTNDLWKWKSFNGWISDISVNSFNNFAAIGTSGTVHGWDKPLKRWREYPGGKKGGLSLTIMGNDEVFVCFATTIERFIPDKNERFKGRWIKIPGCCKDIDSDGFGLLVVVGCDKHQFGFGIWRNLGGNYNNWKRLLGQAVRIGVGSRGHIVVSNNKKDIFWKDSWDKVWQKVPGKAHDVTVSVGGRIVVIGTDQHIWASSTEGYRAQFQQNNGMGYRVSCWNWRFPMVVGMDHAAWRAELPKV